MIVSFNIEPEDLAKLDQLAGPRGRSVWLRRAITRAHDRQRKLEAGRKAITTTPRKKTA